MRAQLGVLLLLVAATAAAEPIYKSADRDGRVSYSSFPPDDAQTISLLSLEPPPSEEQVRQAQAQHEVFEEYNAERAKERKERAEEAQRQRAAAGALVVIERPYAVPVAEWPWWGLATVPPPHPARPPRPGRPHHPVPPPPRIGSGSRR
jgi:hypothetical protein